MIGLVPMGGVEAKEECISIAESLECDRKGKIALDSGTSTSVLVSMLTKMMRACNISTKRRAKPFQAIKAMVRGS